MGLDRRAGERRCDLAVQPVDYGHGRAGRREETGPGVDRVALVPGLRHGRNVGENLGALAAGDRERTQLAGLHMGQSHDVAAHHQRHAPGQHIGERLSVAPVGNVHQLDGSGAREQLHRKMRQPARAAGGIAQPIGSRARQCQ